MYDSGKIITGLVIALIILTFPAWWNLGFATPPAPEPKLAPNAKAAGKCVLPKEEMRTKHMQVLDDWRNKVVRDAQRFYVEVTPQGGERPEMIFIKGANAFVDESVLEFPGFGPLRYLTDGEDQKLNMGDGRLVEMSLQNSCMQCHTSKKEFCDSCHNYAAVTPFCWDCHVEPEEKE